MASMQIGVCIQHDGNHGAFAESRILNRLAGWTLDLISASAFTWEVQHVLGWVFLSLTLSYHSNSIITNQQTSRIHESCRLSRGETKCRFENTTEFTFYYYYYDCNSTRRVGSGRVRFVSIRENASGTTSILVSSISTHLRTFSVCFDDHIESLATRF